MDAVWFAMGAATGIALTAIELRRRWLADRDRLERQVAAIENDVTYVKRIHEADWRRMHAEIDTLRLERAKALIDLHTVKRERLNAWKEASQ